MAILASGQLNPSLANRSPNDVRYGEGQYLSDIVPGTKTGGELSAAFMRIPFQDQRFTHYVEIDVHGLDVHWGRRGVFVIPNQEPLDIGGRVVSSDQVPIGGSEIP